MNFYEFCVFCVILYILYNFDRLIFNEIFIYIKVLWKLRLRKYHLISYELFLTDYEYHNWLDTFWISKKSYSTQHLNIYIYICDSKYPQWKKSLGVNSVDLVAQRKGPDFRSRENRLFKNSLTWQVWCSILFIHVLLNKV